MYLIAGEASGDLLGGHLMRELKVHYQGPLIFQGIGGDKMTAEGLNSLFPYYELAMMGFVEILPYLFNLSARINQTVEDIIAKQPDMVVTIDSPGFCFRVVERLRKEGERHRLKAKFVHYVAPSVWAYKPERAEKCAHLFDHLLALLPFEPPLFEAAGLPCTWVGHPAVAETQKGNGAAFRQRYDIHPDTTLFTLLPGSRKSEVERHMPIFAQALTLLASHYPNLAMAVAVPKNVLAFVAPYFEGCPFRAVITANEADKKDAMAAGNIAIVKSGTVALEVAQAGTPMIVAYKVHPLSAWYIRRKSLINRVNLINILLKRDVVPELLQEECNPLAIANACMQLLAHPDKQSWQKQQYQEALSMLIPAHASPSQLAARVILAQLAATQAV